MVLHCNSGDFMAPDCQPTREAVVNHTQILQYNLEQIGLSPDAIGFVLGIWNMIQVFDDVADGDPVGRKDLDRAIWFSMIGMPGNPFYAANVAVLTPILAGMVLKWQASDIAERAGMADARSYMWRAGFYDVVLIAACIIHGPDKAAELSPTIMAMYGESLPDYLEEFGHA